MVIPIIDDLTVAAIGVAAVPLDNPMVVNVTSCES